MAKDCKKIMRLYNDYKERMLLQAKDDANEEGLELLYPLVDAIGEITGFKDAAKESAMKATGIAKVRDKMISLGTSVVPNVLKKSSGSVFGKAIGSFAGPLGTVAGALFDMATDVTDTSCGSDQYFTYLKNILQEYYTGGNKHIISQNFNLLVDAQHTLIIEKDFGINTNCYNTINSLTEEIRQKYIIEATKIKQG
jgi:hypothetical protein